MHQGSRHKIVSFFQYIECDLVSYHKTHTPTYIKSRSHMVDYCFRLFTVEINNYLSNARNLKPIGMIKMQGVTIYPNIYEYVSDDMKIHYDCF